MSFLRPVVIHGTHTGYLGGLVVDQKKRRIPRGDQMVRELVADRCTGHVGITFSTGDRAGRQRCSQRAGITAFWPSRLRTQLADLEQVKTKRLDLGEDAVQPGLVQHASEDGLRALPLPCHGREGRQQGRAEMTVDPDHVPGGSRVHAAMLRRGQVSAHRQDLVTRP